MLNFQSLHQFGRQVRYFRAQGSSVEKVLLNFNIVSVFAPGAEWGDLTVVFADLLLKWVLRQSSRSFFVIISLDSFTGGKFEGVYNVVIVYCIVFKCLSCHLATAEVGFLSIKKVLLYLFDPEDFNSNSDNMVACEPYGTVLFKTGGGYLWLLLLPQILPRKFFKDIQLLSFSFISQLKFSSNNLLYSSGVMKVISLYN